MAALATLVCDVASSRKKGRARFLKAARALGAATRHLPYGNIDGAPGARS